MDRVRLKTEIEQHAHFDRAANDAMCQKVTLNK